MLITQACNVLILFYFLLQNNIYVVFLVAFNYSYVIVLLDMVIDEQYGNFSVIQTWGLETFMVVWDFVQNNKMPNSTLMCQQNTTKKGYSSVLGPALMVLKKKNAKAMSSSVVCHLRF